MSQAIAIRVTTAGVIYAYGDKNAALTDAGASDKVYEVANCPKTQLCSVSAGVITDNSTAFDAQRRTQKLK